jgi:glycerate dehydrogenase
MKFKKLVSVGISEEIIDKKYWDMLSELAEERVLLPKDSDKIEEELANADGLLVWFNGADKDLIDKAPSLKYIGALATGVGKIDVAYATSKGIVVTNIPGYSTEAVSELVIAVLLENLRDLSRGKTKSKQARTPEFDFSGREIKGRDFGVIGLGRIGTRVAELAKAFGADVYYWSRSPKPDVSDKFKYEELDQMISHCDFLSINLALNHETEGILNAERIAAIKDGAVVINTAPLELIDLEALDERLSKGTITFIFDHTDPDDINDEWLERLRKHDNCITYPVLGYITDEAKTALQEIFVNNAKSFLSGSPTNTVK